MNEDPSPGDDDASTLDPRTHRARSEDMLVALRKTGGIYSVRGESGSVYRVDICRTECTCPDQQKDSMERCKHIRRVEIELRNRTVPTPDGRLPDQPVADGGIGTHGNRDKCESTKRIEGPILEFDKHGQPTGAEYYRCSVCGAEAMREQDLSRCCPVARR